MLSYASAYKMCVPTLSKLLNATARSRRAGPRACRLPDQLAWETLPGSAREGVSSYTEGYPRKTRVQHVPDRRRIGGDRSSGCEPSRSYSDGYPITRHIRAGG